MDTRFGVSAIGWIDDDKPQLGGETALERVLAEACPTLDALGGAGPNLYGQLALKALRSEAATAGLRTVA